MLELPNLLDSFLLLVCSCPALPTLPLLLLSCRFLDLTFTAGILGGRKGAREGAGIQWPIFPSFCLEEDGREREEEGRVDFDGEENAFVEFGGEEIFVVNFDGEELFCDGEENSRACSVAGLG